ncbi:MAG: DNA cytosine methyltransferase [Pseudomonadota bacterium]
MTKATKRHVCVTCKRKRIELKMHQFRQHWQCLDCINKAGPDPGVAAEAAQVHQLKVLNLYAGIGGNRKFWKGCHVTAIEHNASIANAYSKLYPEDTVIIGDAHKYLLKNYHKFDIIWSSPPCQSHTRMNYWSPKEKKRYIDLSLYAEIILLRNFFKGKWTVENVNPYYESLIAPDKQIGRHLFWSNVPISDIHVEQIEGFINLDGQDDKQKIMDWLGIHIEQNLYSTGKNYLQVFRNCVHPDIGLSIFQDLLNGRIPR